MSILVVASVVSDVQGVGVIVASALCRLVGSSASAGPCKSSRSRRRRQASFSGVRPVSCAMAIDLTVAGAMGLKAVAAAKAASAAAKQAAAQAIAMAQNTNLAALQAEQAQANLEKYVYGVPVSSVPPSVSPMPPAALRPFPMKAMSAGAALPAALAAPAFGGAAPSGGDAGLRHTASLRPQGWCPPPHGAQPASLSRAGAQGRRSRGRRPEALADFL